MEYQWVLGGGKDTPICEASLTKQGSGDRKLHHQGVLFLQSAPSLLWEPRHVLWEDTVTAICGAALK